MAGNSVGKLVIKGSGVMTAEGYPLYRAPDQAGAEQMSIGAASRWVEREDLSECIDWIFDKVHDRRQSSMRTKSVSGSA